jgi:hypothetical protein
LAQPTDKHSHAVDDGSHGQSDKQQKRWTRSGREPIVTQLDAHEVMTRRHKQQDACCGHVEETLDPGVPTQLEGLADERYRHGHGRDEEEVTNAAKRQRRLRRRDHCGERSIGVQGGKAEAPQAKERGRPLALPAQRYRDQECRHEQAQQGGDGVRQRAGPVEHGASLVETSRERSEEPATQGPALG